MPSRNFVPRLGSANGANGTFKSPSAVTVKNGVVTSITEGEIAPSGGGSGGGGTSTGAGLAQFPVGGGMYPTSGANVTVTLPFSPNGIVQMMWSDAGFDTNFSVSGNQLSTTFSNPSYVTGICFVFSYG